MSDIKFLEPILEGLLQDANTLSVVVVGSFSRGEENYFSDVDLHVIVKNGHRMHQILYLENRLININFLDKENRESALHDPWMTIRNLAAIREANILFDPEGWYADLQRRTREFDWQEVAQAANLAVSWVMAENAETVQKILGGLRDDNSEKTLRATVDLMDRLANVGALVNGVLANSENRLWSSIRDAEADSIWKTLFWKALGLEAETVVSRARASLHLYCRTAVLYSDKLLPDHAAIVQQVCAFVESEIPEQ